MSMDAQLVDGESPRAPGTRFGGAAAQGANGDAYGVGWANAWGRGTCVVEAGVLGAMRVGGGAGANGDADGVGVANAWGHGTCVCRVGPRGRVLATARVAVGAGANGGAYGVGGYGLGWGWGRGRGRPPGCSLTWTRFGGTSGARCGAHSPHDVQRVIEARRRPISSPFPIPQHTRAWNQGGPRGPFDPQASLARQRVTLPDPLCPVCPPGPTPQRQANNTGPAAAAAAARKAPSAGPPGSTSAAAAAQVGVLGQGLLGQRRRSRACGGCKLGGIRVCQTAAARRSGTDPRGPPRPAAAAQVGAEAGAGREQTV